MKKTSAFLTALVMAAALTACGGSNSDKAGDASKDIVKNTEAAATDTEAGDDGGLDYDKLIIGVDDTFAPMGFLDENNELTG